VTLNYTALAATFGKSIDEITLAVTFTLMSRPLGAAIFGIASDRFGRKWPFVINNILLIILELSTGFCKSYRQFLAVRTMFGIAMGGIYGNAAATALEDSLGPASGLLSGMYQSGYNLGYLLATAFKYALVDEKNYGWRPLFWFGACPPVLIIIFRLYLPETDTYSGRIGFRLERRGIFEEARVAIRKYWLLLMYLILLMTGFSFMVGISMQITKQDSSLHSLTDPKTFIPTSLLDTITRPHTAHAL
jgi:MFS transporter, SHS family, lactate transporter